MRLFIKLLAAMAGLVVLLVIAAAIAVSTVDVNAFVGPIQKRVKDVTGRDLSIRGAVSLKISLEPKLVIEDVSLGNASWGKAPQMLTAKRVEAQMRLLPLLQRRFEIVQFTLVQPSIALETDASGKVNWDFGTAANPAPAAAPTASGTISALAVGDLAITNGALTYRDGDTGKITNVVIESLSLRARDPQSQISAQFRGTIADVAVAVEGDLGPLDSLTQRRWPYPISLHGDINSQKTTVSTKMRVDGPTVAFNELQLATGASTATGSITLTRDGARPILGLTLNATSLAVADFAALRAAAVAMARPATATGAPAVKARGAYVFYDAPIDFGTLAATDADVNVTATVLILADGHRLDNVRIQLSVRGARIDAPVLEASAFGGKATAKLTVDARQANDPSLTLHFNASSLDLGMLLAAFDDKRDVRGGKTSVTADIVAHGVSPRQWVSDMSGNVLAVVGPATLANINLGNVAVLDRLSEAINPFRKTDPTTELTCGVARLPLKNGIATIDHSIAMETKKLGASASGTLDFRTETLDLSFKPQIREGIRIEIPQVAQLVRLRGPFSDPKVGIDATATAATVARIGAAIGTSGLSILGETLFSSATAGGPGPCQLALGASGQTAAQSQGNTQAPAQPANPLAKALDKLFRR